LVLGSWCAADRPIRFAERHDIREQKQQFEVRRLRGDGGSLSERGPDGSPDLPRNAREARRRLRDDEASRDGTRAKAAGGRDARAGASRRTRRKGEGRAAELRQRCHARQDSPPTAGRNLRGRGGLRRTRPRRRICIRRAGRRTRKAPAHAGEHGCGGACRTLERHGNQPTSKLRLGKPYALRHIGVLSRARLSTAARIRPTTSPWRRRCALSASW